MLQTYTLPPVTLPECSTITQDIRSWVGSVLAAGQEVTVEWYEPHGKYGRVLVTGKDQYGWITRVMLELEHAGEYLTGFSS